MKKRVRISLRWFLVLVAVISVIVSRSLGPLKQACDEAQKKRSSFVSFHSGKSKWLEEERTITADELPRSMDAGIKRLAVAHYERSQFYRSKSLFFYMITKFKMSDYDRALENESLKYSALIWEKRGRAATLRLLKHYHEADEAENRGSVALGSQ